MDKDYLDVINGLDSIKLCVIGQDPYPKDPVGIPFCKESFENGIYVKSFSAIKVLDSLGYTEDKIQKIKQSKHWIKGQEFFIWLAKEQGIVFLNLSYDEDKLKNKIRIKEWRSIVNSYVSTNKPILLKSKSKVLLGTTNEKLFKKEYNIDIDIIYHPAARAKTRSLPSYKSVYTTDALAIKYSL